MIILLMIVLVLFSWNNGINNVLVENALRVDADDPHQLVLAETVILPH
jgi:hypothetical protein